MIALLAIVLFAAPPSQVHFTKAQKLFAQGKYREALDAFTEAGEAAPQEIPELWFDIGQCHRNLGHGRQAIASFRRYLALAPDASDREQVIAMIGKLGGNVDDLAKVEPSPPVVEATAPPPDPEPAPAPPQPAPTVVALTAPPPPPPVVHKPARWKLWVGVAGGIAAAVAIGVGVGVGVGVQSGPSPMVGSAVTLDTRH